MRPVRVLFLTWGHSVHAQRRIQLFVDDPAFFVGVVSTFAYEFSGNVRVYPLTAAKMKPSATPASHGDSNSSGQPHRRSAKDWYYAVTRSFVPKQFRDAWWANLDVELFMMIRDFRILRQSVVDFQPDVLFLQTLLYPSYLSYWLPHSLPRVITFWNGDVLWWARWTGLERLIKKWIVSHGVKRAAAITVNSPMAFDACRRYGAPPKNIHLIRYPGVNITKFAPQSSANAKQKLGLVGHPVILSNRGAATYQNLDIIVQAAAQILRSVRDARFIFLTPDRDAPPDHFAPYQALAESLGIQHAVEWHGWVPHDQLPTYLNAADVALSISSKDSLPNAMLESMACGTPLVASNILQIQDWIIHGKNGALVDPRNPHAVANAILGILTAPPTELARMREYNRSLVSQKANSDIECIKVKELVHRIAREAKI